MTFPRPHSKSMTEPGSEPCPSSLDLRLSVGGHSSTPHPSSHLAGQGGLPTAHLRPHLGGHSFQARLPVRGRGFLGTISRNTAQRGAGWVPSDHRLERASLHRVKHLCRMTPQFHRPPGHGCSPKEVPVLQSLIHATC